MLKVLYFPYPKPEAQADETQHEAPEIIYELAAIEGGVRVNVHFSAKEEQGRVPREAGDRQIDINFEAMKGRLLSWSSVLAMGNYTLMVTEQPKIARWDQFLRYIPRSQSHFPILDVAVNEDASEVVVMLRSSTYQPEYSGAEYVELGQPGQKMYLGYMAEHSEFAQRIMTHLWSKHQNTVKWMDVYSNMAYLEAQVDALTRLVLKLAGDKYAGTDEVAILAEADKYSVLDIKTADNMLKEFKEDKGNVRRRQTNLYTDVYEDYTVETGYEV